MPRFAELEHKGDYQTLIQEARDLIDEDPHVLTNLDLKKWMGKRWRNLFITQSLRDPKAMEAASVQDADAPNARQKMSERYLIGDARNEGNLSLPPVSTSKIRNTTVVYCPGLLNHLLPVTSFRDTLPAFAKEQKVTVLRSDLHPMRSAQANMVDLTRTLEYGEGRDPEDRIIPRGEGISPGKIMLICYSKGCVDTLAYLVHNKHMRRRIACVFFWAGPVQGSPIADQAYKKVRDKDLIQVTQGLDKILDRLMPPGCQPPVDRLNEYDVKGAIGDLTCARRQRFLEENREKLAALNIPMFTISGTTFAKEVPLVQLPGFMSMKKHDPQNDMQVAVSDTRLPLEMATSLGVVHGHHWDLAYPSFVKRKILNNMRHPFPKQAAITAMFQLAAELGLID